MIFEDWNQLHVVGGVRLSNQSSHVTFFYAETRPLIRHCNSVLKLRAKFPILVCNFAFTHKLSEYCGDCSYCILIQCKFIAIVITAKRTAHLTFLLHCNTRSSL